MNLHFSRAVTVLLAVGLLAGCSKGAADSADSDDSAENVKSVVTVTTVKPVQRSFHDAIEAFGSAQGDARRARSLNLAHGGEVIAVLVTEGQAVHVGDPLLKIATDPVTRSAYAQAQSALTLARGELARVTQLASQHLATQSQVAAANKAMIDAEAGLQAQQTLGGATAEEAVTAPADGVVTHLQVTLGERVQANAPLLDFTPTKGLIAELGVQPDQAARIKPGMSVLLSAVYGDVSAVQGHVSMLGNAVDAQTHLLPVQASIPATLAAQLVNGAALDAQIQTADYTAWALPRLALRHDDDGDYLFQLDHGKAKRVNVKVRAPDGDTVGVEGALDAALPVVVLGAYELDDGMTAREQAQ